MKKSLFINGILVATGLLAATLFLGVDPALAQSLEPTAYDEGNISSIFERIAKSFETAPGLIAFTSYITGLVVAVTAILKTKQAFDDPQTSPREAIARILIAGGLFALPTVVNTAMITIGSGSGMPEMNDILGDAANAGGSLMGMLGSDSCDSQKTLGAIDKGLGGIASGNIVGGILGGLEAYNTGTIGMIICYGSSAFTGMKGLIMSVTYIAGLFMILWGLLQLRDHLLKPDNVPANAPIKKFLLGGAFLALPTVLKAAASTMDGGGQLDVIDPFLGASCATGATGNLVGVVDKAIQIVDMLVNDTSSSSSGASSGGLDCMMIRLISDIWGPTQTAISIFVYLAGILLIALALRRMLDNMDKGLKSPVGMGTIAMILIGGIFLSFDSFLRTISGSLFTDIYSDLGLFASVNLYAQLQYAPGINEADIDRINMTITSALAFVFLVGIISVVRGLFLMKEVANGGNASMMAAMTHILGGGMAMNIGSVINAVEATLGLSGVGIVVGM